MPKDPVLPSNFYAEMKELERRVRKLETTNQLLASTIKGGVLRIQDEGGVSVAAIGRFVSGEDGLAVNRDATNVHLWVTDGSGVIRPWFQHDWFNPEDTRLVTSGTFFHAWQAFTEIISSNSIRFRFHAYTDATTSMEMKLEVNGVQLKDTLVLGPNTSGWHEFMAQHGRTILTGPFTFSLLVRRSAGSGNAYVGRPLPLTVGGASTFLPNPMPASGWILP